MSCPALKRFSRLWGRLPSWAALSLWVAATGCRGPLGPPGIDAQGFDTVPPTIQLTQPWPLSVAWDEFEVRANAVDDVDVREVMFTVDGSPLVSGRLLVSFRPPHQFTVDGGGLARGWHFVAARAYDLANNVTDTPVVPIWLGFSVELQDTLVRVAYHNGDPHREWSIPDSVGASALWVRFNPARDCLLQRVFVRMGGALSDSVAVRVGIWRGAGIPGTAIAADTLAAGDVAGQVTERQVEFENVKLSDRNDFFVVVALVNRSDEDTLRLAADDGGTPWGRSGSRDDEGWHHLDERYGAVDNLMMECELYYENIQYSIR